MLGFANEREFCLGGSGDIRGSRKAAGRHCSRGGRICSAEEGWAKFPRPVPVPFRKNAIVQRASDAADLSLLRLRQGRRRLQLRDGNGEVRISRRGASGGGEIGIAVPRARDRSPQERKQNQQRSALVEMQREAQTFFVQQLEGTAEGKAARAYLEDRGLDKSAIERFGIGYAPSGGDTLLRFLKQKYSEKLLADSGLVSRSEQGDRMFDRFRRRITFPIANESGKIVAFVSRTLGADQPQNLTSPE